MHLLDQVEMADQADKLPSAISGGQQQRVAIARALANDPPIIVADEPTGNLDSKTAQSVFTLFEDLVNKGKTILMVTHDQDLAKRVSRTVILADGEIVDEYVVKAFPALNEEQWLRVTHQLQAMRFAPGADIIKQGEPGDRFYIITKGRVEVVIIRPDGQEIVVDHMGTGQFFGEMSLLRGGKRNATVRALHNSEVEVAALGRETFIGLLEESKVAREEIERVVNERVLNLKEKAHA
jgi:putative ABC transport system ATP-binding protein